MAKTYEYDDGGRTELGLKAREDNNGNTYLETPAANIYDGIFVFPSCFFNCVRL